MFILRRLIFRRYKTALFDVWYDAAGFLVGTFYVFNSFNSSEGSNASCVVLSIEPLKLHVFPITLFRNILLERFNWTLISEITKKRSENGSWKRTKSQSFWLNLIVFMRSQAIIIYVPWCLHGEHWDILIEQLKMWVGPSLFYGYSIMILIKAIN